MSIEHYSYQEQAVMARNQVLRNTYLLLAISLVPTVLGAWLMSAIGLAQGIHGFTYLILFILTFGVMFLVQANRNNPMGIVFLLGFTFLMGVLLSGSLAFVASLRDGANIITMAFVGTIAMLGTMSFLSMVIKRDLGFLSKALFAGVIVLIVMGLVNMFLQLPALMLAGSVMGVVIFSAFLLIDLQRVVNGGETNYINATLAIYLDLINIFISLLNILTALDSRR